jgi:hypothetical protein
MTRLGALALLLLPAAPLAARESLGVYEQWGAFKDARPARCYAIAKAQNTPAAPSYPPAYASISHWPERNVRGALHIVLSREVSEKDRVRLVVGDKRFELLAKGRNAWARDARDEAAIVAAMRAASRMRVSGAGFTDRYTLAGAASAIDAATVGCARRKLTGQTARLRL